ncbi:MAG: hypothetical protein MJZ26_05185 [Fibrobacter sp.]|nr:hypothetical protein [Fibrobacter sp.]
MTLRSVVLAGLCSAGAFLFSGCDGFGEKDSILAKINDEKVFQEDVTYYYQNNGTALKVEKNKFLYDNFYAKAALVSRALKEYPDLKKEWEDYYKEIDPRILTMVYQRFYAMEKMTYSDEELRNFYYANRNLFPTDTLGQYELMRGEAAAEYYLNSHKDSLDKFLAEMLKNAGAPNADDTLGLRKRFVHMRRQEIRTELSENLLEKNGIQINELPAVDGEAYYNSHKSEYMTVPGYELYHVEGTDSASLAGMFKEGISLEQFKQLAATKSKNASTAKDSGYVGVVKKDFSLPYGIGMVPTLSLALEGKDAGFVTGALRSEPTGIFHRFFLVRNVPAEVKPYDRVAGMVKADAASGAIFELAPEFVLVSKNGKALLTEKELLEFKARNYASYGYDRNFHDRLVKMLADNMAYADAARALALNETADYRAVVRSARIDFITEKYLDRKRGLKDVPEDTLKAWYQRVGSPIHVGYDYEKAKDDLRLIATFPKNLYDHQYNFGYRVIYAGKTYEQSIPAIYQKRGDEWLNLYRARLSAEAYSTAKVSLYDNSIPEFKPELLADVMLSRVDSLHKAGNLTPSYNGYRMLMYAYAEDDELFQKVAYEMAQIQAENEEFLDADAEYNAFYKMWPQNENAEKALFSRGFILNENLGMNDVALEVFKEFNEKYPNSELKESVDWLVKNIETNGKLAEDLMKKIESAE